MPRKQAGSPAVVLHRRWYLWNQAGQLQVVPQTWRIQYLAPRTPLLQVLNISNWLPGPQQSPCVNSTYANGTSQPCNPLWQPPSMDGRPSALPQSQGFAVTQVQLGIKPASFNNCTALEHQLNDPPSLPRQLLVSGVAAQLASLHVLYCKRFASAYHAEVRISALSRQSAREVLLLSLLNAPFSCIRVCGSPHRKMLLLPMRPWQASWLPPVAGTIQVLHS
jgi:hypothetical protein